jgi:hypothetical protein
MRLSDPLLLLIEFLFASFDYHDVFFHSVSGLRIHFVTLILPSN